MKIIRSYLVLTILVFTYAFSNAYAAVIFQDDLESDPSNWTCSNGDLSKWDANYGSPCCTCTGFGATAKMGAGAHGSNAMYVWKKSGCGLQTFCYGPTKNFDPQQEVYVRFYMKIPPASQFNKSTAHVNGAKFWRHIIGQPYVDEIYFMAYGASTWAACSFYFLNHSGMDWYPTNVSIEDVNDNTWHCMEYHIKLNTSGSANGILEFWLDGVKKCSYTNVTYRTGGSGGVCTLTEWGIGNSDMDFDWSNTSWAALGLDDLAVSTTYVGPITGGGGQGSTAFLTEAFDDTSYSSRGWYDYTSPIIDTSVKHTGAASLRFDWASGSNGPTGNMGRYKFTASDSVYISYWTRFSSGWQGFGANSPHMIYFLTNTDGDYASLAYSHTTAYVELDGTSGNYNYYSTMKLQDSANINTSYINQNRCSASENRDVNGCNGNCDGRGTSSCYQSTSWYNGRVFQSSTSYTPDTSWHHVEAYLKMNTVSGGVGQKDGIMQMWLDGVQQINFTDVIIRTNQNASMKFNQLIINPWGSASPKAQSMWVDDLTLSTTKSGSSQDLTPPSSPTGVQIQILQ